jgi:hypothetical protein
MKLGGKHSEETKKKMSLNHADFSGEKNHNFGKHLSEETRRKIGTANTGRKMPPRSEEYRKRISEIHKGKIVSEETRKKQSDARKGKPSSRKGVHLSVETKQKLRNANIGKKLSLETKAKIGKFFKGKPVWNTGKRYKSPKQSLRMSGNGNSNWRGGKSFELYTVDWTKTLKRSIRERDNYICQICGNPQEDVVFSVHHIDYDKKNCNPNNLITLCRKCHSKTNFNRDLWSEYFRKELNV